MVQIFAGSVYHRFTPEAFPVLKTEDTAACFVTDSTLGAHGQVTLEPLVGHGHAIFVLYDVLPDGGQGRPFAVICRSHCTPFMSFEFTHFAGQAVGGDSRKTLSAHVTESGSGMGAGVPVMHPS